MAFVRLPAILLGSIIVGLSLPHVANVRFKAMISLGPAPGLGPVVAGGSRIPGIDPYESVATGSYRVARWCV
jgi:hypothetical protein